MPQLHSKLLQTATLLQSVTEWLYMDYPHLAPPQLDWTTTGGVGETREENHSNL